MEMVKNELAKLPVISQSTLSYEIPDGNNGGSENIYRQDVDSSKAIAAKLLIADEKYAATYQIPLRDRLFFNAYNGNYDPLNIVINEAAAKSLGWAEPGTTEGNKIRLTD